MRKQFFASLSILILAGLTFGMSFSPSASATVPGTNYLVSQDSSANYANNSSGNSLLSGDGRYVAFESRATNLVSGVNNYQNVFVKDTATGNVTLASVHWSSGVQFATDTSLRDISYDGRYVVFTYTYSGLLAVRDLLNNTTTPVCQVILGCSSYGMKGGSISADGRYVAYTTQDYAGHKYQATVTDMQTNTSKILSATSGGVVGNNDSYPGDISCDGGVITFSTGATNLPGAANGYIANITLNGNVNLTPTIITQKTKVSCNGNIILNFLGTNIVEYNRLTNQSSTIASINYPIKTMTSMAVSDDGRFVAYATNDTQSTVPSYPTTGAGTLNDAYIYDARTGMKQLVSFTASGNKSGLVGGINLSDDGTKISLDYQTPTATDTSHSYIAGLTTGTSNTQTDIYTSLTGY